METFSVFQAGIKTYENKIPFDDIKPYEFQIIDRLLFAFPILSCAGVLAASTLTQFTAFAVPKLVGCLLGSSFAVVNTLTTLACKELGISIKEKSWELAKKYIVDIAIAALLTYAACYLEKTPFIEHSLPILLLSMAPATIAIFMAASALKITELDKGLNRLKDNLIIF